LEPIVEKARNAGVTVRLLGSDTWEQDRLAMMTEYDGSFITNSWNRDVPRQATGRFVKQYLTRFNEQPNGDSALTFDAFQLLFRAIEEQQSISPEVIQKWLYRLGPYSGVTGTIDFVTSGDPEKGVVVMHLKNGKSTFHKMVTSAEMKSER
jgi:branched-chain amino acid transport system substrate-binding protein